MLDNESSFVTWAPEAGLLLCWNEDEENPVYLPETNSYEDFISAGFCLWAFRDGSAMTGEQSSDWFKAHESWYFGLMTSAIDMVRSLTKVD